MKIPSAEKAERMGYDRTIAMFSPDGRLLQVEYAKKTVRQGSTAIGLVCQDGVVLAADKKITSSLIVPESVEKIFKIDDHIGAAASGIMSDARVLLERAQLKAQQHRLIYDGPIDLLSILKDIGSLYQITTQTAGLRPFGVSLIIAGIGDEEPKLFLIDPTGTVFQYKAAVIGEGELEVERILEKDYKPTPIREGINLAISILKTVLKKEFDLNRVEVAYINTKEKIFTRLYGDNLNKFLKSK